MYYNDGSKAYLFNSDNETFIVKVDYKNQIIANRKVISLDTNTFEVIGADENYIVKFIDGVPHTYTYTNSAGRSRLPGESFNSCFVRTWNEFASDALGIVATIISPREVAAAVAISCTITLSAPKEIDYIGPSESDSLMIEVPTYDIL